MSIGSGWPKPYSKARTWSSSGWCATSVNTVARSFGSCKVLLTCEIAQDLMDRNRPLTVALAKGVLHSGKSYGQDKHYDQCGLILRLMPSGGEPWVLRGMVHGKRLNLSGWLAYVPLAEARHVAFEYRTLDGEGGNAIRFVPSRLFRPMLRRSRR